MPLAPHDISDATMALLLADGLGPVTLRKLRERFGDDASAAAASISELTTLQGIGRQTAESLRRSIDEADVDTQRRMMLECDVQLLTIDDPAYPALLASIEGAPPALWMRGRLDPADNLAIAMVGSRRCSGYGREQAGRFSTMLAQSGLTIVSGGALGIDGESHRAALRVNGRTLAVLGCGLDIAYPREHGALFDEIVASGSAVLSEFAMAIPPRAENFPRRNRIISGLSLGVLVIEAANRSGALITARKAADEHGREVMALPGRVDSPASAGCLQAIREGWAALVRNHVDVLEQLDSAAHLLRGAQARLQPTIQHDADMPPGTASSASDQRAGLNAADSILHTNLTESQQRIVAALTDHGSSMAREQIAAQTSLAMQQLLADLTILEIRGLIGKDVAGRVRLARPAAQSRNG